MRLMGALVIFAASGAIGVIIGRLYLRRVKILQDMIVSLQQLQTKIHYTREAMPEALAAAGAQRDSAAAPFFASVSQQINDSNGSSLQSAWENSLSCLGEQGMFNSDMELVAPLGAVLGQSDVDDQARHISLLQDQLNGALDQAQADKEKNVRLWNYLGFSAGAMLVILFW